MDSRRKNFRPRPPALLVALWVILGCVWFTPPSFAEIEAETFHIGISSRHDLARDAHGRRMVQAAYAQALGRPVEISIFPDQASLVRAVARGAADYSVYSATAYALTWHRCACVAPLAAPVSADGWDAVKSVLLFRTPAPQSIDLIVERRIAILTDHNLAGRVIPLASLAPGGLALSGSESFLHPVQSAAEAEKLFVEGQVDGIFGWAPVGDGITPAARGTKARLTERGTASAAIATVWSSESYRFGPHVVRTDVEENVKEALLAFLLTLKDEQPDVYDRLESRYQGGFSAVSHADYTPVLSAVGD